MAIKQFNIFGTNVINVNQSRILTEENKEILLAEIKKLGANSAIIRYENGGETQEFSEMVGSFLMENDITVRLHGGTYNGEIRRNQFSISSHPSDPNCVFICIGPIL